MNRRDSFHVILSSLFLPHLNQDGLLREHNKLTPIEKIACRYFTLVTAYCQHAPIHDDEDGEPFMRSIETRIDIPEPGVDDFRRMVASFLGYVYTHNKELQWNSNPELARAFEMELAARGEDQDKNGT